MSSTKAFGTAYFDDEAEALVNAIADDLGADREEFLDELTDGLRTATMISTANM